MRWVPIGLIGAGATAMGWISGPLFENWETEPAYGLNFWMPWGWLAILFYAPFFLAIVGGTVLAFRALWLATRRADLAARIAMGSTRASLIASQVREGLRDGLIAGGGGILLGALARQLVTGFSNVEFVSNTLWDYLAVVILVVVCFTLAYWIAAIWATRGSVREVASGTTADARVAKRLTRGAPGRRSRRRVVLTVASALGAVSIGLLVASPTVLQSDGTSTGALLVFQVVSWTVMATGLYVAVPGLLVYAGAKAAVWLARVTGRALARSAGPGSARSLAAEGLERPTPIRTGAVAAVVAVMGTAVTATAMYFSLEDANRTAADLAPHASISTVELVGASPSLSDASGWADPLPRDLVAQLHEDPALTVIDVGVLTTDARDREAVDQYGEPYVETARDLLLAVEPEALDGVVAGAARQLYLTDGTLWLNGSLGSGFWYDGEAGLTVNGTSAEVVRANGPTPWAGISRPWAEGIWGLAPTAAVLVYPSASAAVADTLDAYDLDGLEVVQTDVSLQWHSSASAAQVAAATVPFLLIAVMIVIALAWSGQRLRASDQATMLALGATPAALRGAASLESFVLTAAAGAVGCLGGSIVGPVLSAFASSAPVTAVGPGLVLWNAGHALTVMPWGLLVGLVLGAAAAAAGGAALIRVRLDRLTPAEQLTEAQKAGIS